MDNTPISGLLDEEKDMKLRRFLLKFDSRVKMWAEAHSKEPDVASNPPVYWDEYLKDFIWINRETRRMK